MVRLDVDLEHIGVVIPAFNAEETIGSLIEDIITQGGRPENIIVVNDGSFDKTGEIAGGFDVTLVSHKKNLGKGAALKHGFEVARSKYINRIFTLDADGQHKVAEMDGFLKDKDKFDLIIGFRYNMASMPKLRQLVNRTTSLVVSLLAHSHLVDVQCGFRLIDLAIFDRLILKTNNYQTESEMVIKAARLKYRIGSMPITTVYDKEKSYIKPFIDTLRFLIMAVGSLWR